jgi:hypothetical protein
MWLKQRPKQELNEILPHQPVAENSALLSKTWLDARPLVQAPFQPSKFDQKACLPKAAPLNRASSFLCKALNTFAALAPPVRKTVI